MSEEFQVVPEKSLPKKKSKSRRSAARGAPVEEAVEVEQPAPQQGYDPPRDESWSRPMTAEEIEQLVKGQSLKVIIPDADEAAGRAWAASLTPGQRAWLRGAMDNVRFGG